LISQAICLFGGHFKFQPQPCCQTTALWNAMQGLEVRKRYRNPGTPAIASLCGLTVKIDQTE
jgi:hypothetical protein